MIDFVIFWKIFVPVFIVVIYPGPCVLSYGNISINHGYKKGYACVLGCYTVEIFYWLIGIFALNQAQSLLPDIAIKLISLFAGCLLLYISYDFFKTDISKQHNIKSNSYFGLYLKFLFLTLSNPISIAGYAGIFIAIENMKENLFTILLASSVASFIAHTLVVLCSGTIGKLLNKNKTKNSKIIRYINIISAICISGYAIVEIFYPVIKSFFIK